MPTITLKGACTCCCSFLLFSLVLVSPQGVGSEEILTIKTPAVDSPTMPKVTFNHDRHASFVEEHEKKDCTRCHTTDETTLLDVSLQKKDRQTAYMHRECTACHKEHKRGPSLAQCRSCHAQGNAAQEMKKNNK